MLTFSHVPFFNIVLLTYFILGVIKLEESTYFTYYTIEKGDNMQNSIFKDWNIGKWIMNIFVVLFTVIFQKVEQKEINKGI